MATQTRPRDGNAQQRPIVVRRRHRHTTTMDDVEAAAADGVSWLRDQVKQNPWPAVGAAAAAGWVLGGGLTPRILLMFVGTAGRLAMAQLLASGLKGVVHGTTASADTATAEAEG